MKKLLPLLLVLAPGCSSTRYGDPSETETLTIDFGSTDLQRLAGEMTESLIAAPQLTYLQNPAKGDDLRIITFMGGVENRTTEHVDTQAITDQIRASLLQSGKFRFVAGDAGQAEIGEQVRFQQGSGRVDPAWARSFGQQLGAEVVLYGALRSIDKEEGRSLESLGGKRRDLYYQFALNCVNIDTGEIVWTDIAEIRKKEYSSVFGG